MRIMSNLNISDDVNYVSMLYFAQFRKIFVFLNHFFY